ncbi:MAG: nucleotidyltransferase family protein [Clostridia bacterium]|nr:nucleotidyltransferase family protein [Clostridia bacterium]
MKLGVVLLAAGRSERFGGNKLLADYCGRPMVCRALEAATALRAACTAVVTGCGEIACLAEAYGCEVITNDAPQLGQSHSICLGVRAMQDMDAVLLMVCDQPRLTGASLERLVQDFMRSEKGIACLRDGTHQGNPAVFSRRYFDELLALQGDRGAKGVLRAHEDDLLVVDTVGPDELADADTPDMLAALCKGE